MRETANSVASGRARRDPHRYMLVKIALFFSVWFVAKLWLVTLVETVSMDGVAVLCYLGLRTE